MTLYDENILYDYTILYDGAQWVAITLTETISLFESLLYNSDLQVTLTDSITLTELLATAQTLVANLTEMLSLTESMTTAANIWVAMQESITLLDQLYTGLEIHLTDNIDMSEYVQIWLNTQLQEIVNITEQLTTQSGYHIETTENLHLLDMLRQCVNGIIDVWWQRVEPTTTWETRTKPTTSWSSRTAPTTTWTNRVVPWMCTYQPTPLPVNYLQDVNWVNIQDVNWNDLTILP